VAGLVAAGAGVLVAGVVAAPDEGAGVAGVAAVLLLFEGAVVIGVAGAGVAGVAAVLLSDGAGVAGVLVVVGAAVFTPEGVLE
jgi:hypothetical protein